MLKYFSKIRTFSLVAAFALSLASISTSRAQSSSSDAASSIKYGDTVTGEITSNAANVSFQFTGQAKDVVVIQFIPVANKDYSILATPIFTLQNSKGRKIADTSKSSILVLGGGKGSVFAVSLPEDGDYTVGIARDSASKTNGSFTLHVDVAPLLEKGKTVKGTFSSKAKGVVYGAVYAIDSTDNFGLAYVPSNGDYAPSMRIETVDDSGIIYTTAILAGDKILSSTLDVGGSKSLYLVAIGDIEQDLRSDASEQKASYTLALTAPSAASKSK